MTRERGTRAVPNFFAPYRSKSPVVRFAPVSPSLRVVTNGAEPTEPDSSRGGATFPLGIESGNPHSSFSLRPQLRSQRFGSRCRCSVVAKGRPRAMLRFHIEALLYRAPFSAQAGGPPGRCAAVTSSPVLAFDVLGDALVGRGSRCLGRVVRDLGQDPIERGRCRMVEPTRGVETEKEQGDARDNR